MVMINAIGYSKMVYNAVRRHGGLE